MASDLSPAYPIRFWFPSRRTPCVPDRFSSSRVRRPVRSPRPTSGAMTRSSSTDPRTRCSQSFRFRSIGPASMGGRIDDIAVAESNPSVIYVGYATGGVFKSENNATTFEPVFETYGSASIGDIAIDPTNPNIVYVGTGEPNNRQTSTFGDGIYKSTDGGKTFTNIGTARDADDRAHRDRSEASGDGLRRGAGPPVRTGPRRGRLQDDRRRQDLDQGQVSSTRTPASPTSRSIRRTRTCCTRRAISGAARGCCFNGGGPGSGLWKTEDAGKNWTRLTGNGLPGGTYGRIALDVSRSNPNVVYAQIETDSGAEGAAGGAGLRRSRRLRLVQQRRARAAALAGAGARPAATRPAQSAEVDGNAFRRLPVRQSGSVVDGGEQLQRAAALLQPVARRSLERPTRSTSAACARRSRPMAARRSPRSTAAAASTTRPRTTTRSGSIRTIRNHLMRGSDAGLAVSWDQGETWEYVRTMATALAYWVSADMGHPYHVFAGFQDNDSVGAGPARRAVASASGVRTGTT